MGTHPVQFHAEHAPRRQRIHVLIRLVLLLALGAVGLSSLYWLFYLALPAIAALLIAQKGAAGYLADDAPPIIRAVRWLAAAYAYLWLLTDEFPTREAGGPVELAVAPEGNPTAGSALLRLIYTLPALLLLAILSIAAAILWVVSAICILVSARIPAAFADFFELKLRFQFRLAAYHLSLVDRYPSLESSAPVAVSDQSFSRT